MARVALITGAARRVGRAIALRLAEEGLDIAFTFHRSDDDAAELCELITRLGRRCEMLKVDLARTPDGPTETTAWFRGRFDRLDVLVNNASRYAPSESTSDSGLLLRSMMALHVETPLLLCRTLRGKLEAAGGSVINMLDIMAERPWPRYAEYCASKAALWNLTLALTRELAPLVRVNGIAPGVLEWPEDMAQADREAYLRRVPLGRAGSPQDAAEAVAFLALRAPYVTGQILRIDGGRSLA